MMAVHLAELNLQYISPIIRNLQLFVEAVLWIARTGCFWQDFSEEFGRWNTVFKRFRRWVMADTFYNVFRAKPSDALTAA